MKKINFYLFILLLQFSQNVFSQIGSQFNKGFDEGYKETLRDAGIIGSYPEHADSRMCESKNTYINDKKANEKIYADGYRCGVSQASKAIVKINNSLSNREKQYDNTSIKDIQNNIDALERKIRNGLPTQQVAAVNSQIQALEQEKSNLMKSTKTANDSKKKQQEEYSEIQQSNLDENKRIQTNNYNQEVLMQLKQNQIESQNNYNQEISNTLNSLSRSMQALAYRNIKNELDRRRNVANNFVSYHSDKISKLTNLYNQVPKNNFSKNLNGLYSAHLFNSRKYSFVNNQELVTETGCLVNVENNVIKNIYLYGKEKFELNYPQENPENSMISNGIVKYSNYETLETVTLLILEPYMSKTQKKYSLIKDGVGFLTIWTDNKKEEGKILYVQELDAKGNIVREISTPLTYAKNEALIDSNKTIKLPMNSGNNFLFFGEVTQTPYGRFPLYPKMSTKDGKALDDGEERIIEIKKYRE